MIIAFEGIGSCGKSTQIRLLSDYFERRGIDHVILKGGGPGGNTKKLMDLKAKIDRNGDPDCSFLAKTIELQLAEINKAIDKGVDKILLDRTPATYFASAFSKGKIVSDYFPESTLKLLSQFPKPDKVIWLKISPENAHKLMAGKADLSWADANRNLQHDQLKNDFYANLAEKESWIAIDTEHGGANKTPAAIHSEILEAIKQP